MDLDKCDGKSAAEGWEDGHRFYSRREGRPPTAAQKRTTAGVMGWWRERAEGLAATALTERSTKTVDDLVVAPLGLFSTFYIPHRAFRSSSSVS